MQRSCEKEYWRCINVVKREFKLEIIATLHKIQKYALKTNNSAQSFPTGIVVRQITKEMRLTHYHNTSGSTPGQWKYLVRYFCGFSAFLKRTAADYIQVGHNVFASKTCTALRARTHLVIHMGLKTNLELIHCRLHWSVTKLRV